MLTNFLKIAFRSFLKNRVTTLINIAGLTLGMLCCILILLWVHDELCFDKFHKNKEQLYQVVNQLDGEWGSSSPWALSTVLKKDYPEIEKSTRFSQENILIKYKDQSFYESAGLVDPDFLEMFSFPLVKGDSLSALNNMASIVISEKVADKYFKNENPIGKTIQVNKNMNLAVTGVIKNLPSNSSMTFDVLIPVANIGEERLSSWAWETTAFVQIKKNVSLDNLRAKIAGTTGKYDKRVEGKTLINDLLPISRIHLYSLNGIGPILYIYLFSSVAIIVLIIACINFINLFTSTSSLRGKEIGIRKVVGAEKRHIVWQFYGETFLISLIALIFANVLVSLLLPGFNTLTEKQLKIDFGNATLVIGSIIIILLTTVVAGSYPALLLSSFRPIKVLKCSNSIISRRSTLRWVLVVVQFSVSVILITLTITMVDQIDFIQSKSLGFNREQVISIPMNDDLQNHYESMRDQLLQNPGITHVTSANNSPMEIGTVNPVYWEGRGPDQYEFFNYFSVNYDFLETFEMKLIEGRSFSKEFSTDGNNYIVNETAVKHMRLKDPVGKLFSIWKNEGKIIGIVKDFHSHSLHNEITPLVITMTRFLPHSSVFIKIKPDNIKSSLAYIERTWKEYVSNYPFQYEFLDETFHKQYVNEDKRKILFQYFSAFAIFISCIGLFGLAAFMAQSRTKEIGIRKVVGANVLNLIVLMLKDFTKWILIGITISIPVSYYAVNKWLQNFAYRIEIAWWIFVLAGSVALVIALITVSFQAIKAATANPIKSLKYE